MNEWWLALGGAEKIFFLCAVPATSILIIQMITTFMGFDGDMDTDSDFSLDVDVDPDSVSIEAEADMDGDLDEGGSFPIFTFRNFVAFFTVFGWTGILMIRNGIGLVITLVGSLAAGGLMMFLISSLFYGVSKLASSGGTYRLSQAIGKEGTVYIRIPKAKGGYGKINILINNQQRELDALTEAEEDLLSGTIVRVSKIINNKLIVERA